MPAIPSDQPPECLDCHVWNHADTLTERLMESFDKDFTLSEVKDWAERWAVAFSTYGTLIGSYLRNTEGKADVEVFEAGDGERALRLVT